MLIDEITSEEFETSSDFEFGCEYDVCEQLADEEFYIANKVDNWKVEEVLKAITPDGGWHPLVKNELTESGEYHSLWNPQKPLLGGILGKAMAKQRTRV